MKQTRRQIEENLRKKLSAQFKTSLEQKNETLMAMHARVRHLEVELRDLKAERFKLVEELDKYKDWNRRLLEFFDMSDEERAGILEVAKKQAESQEDFNQLSIAISNSRVLKQLASLASIFS